MPRRAWLDGRGGLGVTERAILAEGGHWRQQDDQSHQRDAANRDGAPGLHGCFHYFAHGTPSVRRKLSVHPYCMASSTKTMKIPKNHFKPRFSDRSMKNKSASVASMMATDIMRTNICDALMS